LKNKNCCFTEISAFFCGISLQNSSFLIFPAKLLRILLFLL